MHLDLKEYTAPEAGPRCIRFLCTEIAVYLKAFLLCQKPEEPAAGVTHSQAAEGHQGERSETLVPEATY